jgi:hypothetical protein
MPKLPVGRPTKDGKLRIAATLSKPLFRRLRTRAAKEGKTMSGNDRDVVLDRATRPR